MKLVSLEVQNFRNIRALTLTPHEEFSFIKGDNGQGKTNLMEALYVLFNLRPLRTGSDFKPLVTKEEDYFSIRAQVMEERERELFLSFSKGKKRVMVDGVKVTPREFISHGPLHFFSPDQATLIVESPEVRRRALDRSIFHIDSSYFELLTEFKGLLKRRNTILKMERDPHLLASIDHLFAPLAFEVSRRRRQFMERLEPWFEKAWAALKPDTFPLSVAFEDRCGEGGTPASFAELLKQSAERDFARGSSSHGPQREDVLFQVEGSASKFFISHGERKIAALAFSLAVISMLLSETTRVPLLLIDDLAAELDTPTRLRVLEFLKSIPVQIIMTGITFPWDEKIGGTYLTITNGALQA